jgi:hypothetical protein
MQKRTNRLTSTRESANSDGAGAAAVALWIPTAPVKKAHAVGKCGAIALSAWRKKRTQPSGPALPVSRRLWPGGGSPLASY